MSRNYFSDRLSTSPSSLSSITGTILSSMRSLHISENSVSALMSSLLETAAEIRSRPPAEQFGTFRGSTANCLKSPDRLVTRFGFRLQGEGQHELHRAFPFLCVGPACQDPRAQVRASAHVGCTLGAPRERAPDPRLRKWASSPGNIPLLKTFSRCGILTGGSRRCCLAFSVIPSGGGSFTPR
jgi:hypothetical protein